MHIRDIAVTDVAGQWFDSRRPGEAMPGCLAWLPDQIPRQRVLPSRSLEWIRAYSEHGR